MPCADARRSCPRPPTIEKEDAIYTARQEEAVALIDDGAHMMLAAMLMRTARRRRVGATFFCAMFTARRDTSGGDISSYEARAERHIIYAH